jgi:hypothetical protein
MTVRMSSTEMEYLPMIHDRFAFCVSMWAGGAGTIFNTALMALLRFLRAGIAGWRRASA